MKIKLISALIAGITLVGCGSDSDTPHQKTTAVYAYDGPINGMAATYICIDSETGKKEQGTTIEFTDGYGKVNISSDTFANYPESCSLTFKVPNNGQAFDMLNKKDMSEVIYTIPQGYLIKGQKITASPLTTFLDRAIKENNYTDPGNIDFDAIIEEAFLALNIDTSIIDPRELMNDPKNTLLTLAKTAIAEDDIPLYIAQDITTKIMVLSDVLTSQSGPTTRNAPKKVQTIVAATKNLTTTIVKTNKYFPNKEFRNTDKPIYVDLVDDLKLPNAINNIANNIIPDSIIKDIKTPVNGEKQNPQKPPVKPTSPPATGGGDGGSTD